MKQLWPAALAVGVLVAVYLLVRGGREETPVQAIERPTQPHQAPPAPRLEPSGEATPPPMPPGGVTEGPPAAAKKPKMTLEEKLVETGKHIEVMNRRAALLDKEIADLEQQGKHAEAAEQRVIVERLRAHVKELQKAIDEKREPQ